MDVMDRDYLLIWDPILIDWYQNISGYVGEGGSIKQGKKLDIKKIRLRFFIRNLVGGLRLMVCTGLDKKQPSYPTSGLK